MFYDITLWVIMSLILIAVVHYLFNFFKETMTVPKVKDLVQQPMEHYKTIDSLTNNSSDEGTTKIQDIGKNTDDMKDELKNFFNDLKNQNAFDNPQNNFSNNIDTKLYNEIR